MTGYGLAFDFGLAGLGLLARGVIVVGQMQLMHHPVEDRRQDEAGDADEQQPRIERIKTFKQLAAIVMGSL